ncbi:MAG TPA: TIGR03085 family metal-binding protein [Ornithinimicrobium sp.]|uniref:TIGR03085 family metal-binding protein n=1 Tax=Ornithinimicrobium sp. TaxID=1977084 RepID=UPI002B485098|nr:TIGR03085 family metal-binding protein [Ornithinimicrobium sp.]HKJ11865.1 TIGR03085 family metal-binding protein [Ornithinimicrobium sp.]
MNLAQEHRRALCESAVRAGADAPTLCGDWSVRDLLVHLVVREGRPDVTAAGLVPAGRGYADRVQAEYAAMEFDDLVARVRNGPPRLSPLSIARVDDAANTVEFVLHHVDIVRATPSRHGPAFEEVTHRAMFTTLRRLGRLLFRQAPVGVVVVAPGRGRAALRRPRPGHGSVVLTGEPVELMVYASGRRAHASVEISGDTADTEALAATPLGM